jgi:periplasmic protein TonB
MLRLVTILLSLGLHAALLLPFISFGGGAALEAGTGNDQVVVEQGIAIEGLAKFGEAEEMIETVDIPPVAPVETQQPVEEVKPELTDVVTSTESKHEEQVKTDEPKPVEEPKPQAVPVEAQAPQVATLIEQSSGAAQQGGDTTERRAYLGQISKTIQRKKVNPRSTLSGTVLVRFSVSPKGEILSRTILQSSGSKLLDDAAIASLERAAPFPPLPQAIASGPLEVQVPFRFVTR